jgi:hypothetical protein
MNCCQLRFYLPGISVSVSMLVPTFYLLSIETSAKLKICSKSFRNLTDLWVHVSCHYLEIANNKDVLCISKKCSCLQPTGNNQPYQSPERPFFSYHRPLMAYHYFDKKKLLAIKPAHIFPLPLS